VTNYVEYGIVGDQMTHGVIDHMVYMASTNEFERNVVQFKYFKIIGVKIIIQPRLTYEISPVLQARISYDWISNLQENILADDSAKEVNCYNTRPKIYRFKPPNVLVNRNGLAYNLGSWMPTNIDLNYIPGWIKVSSEFPLYFCVETIVKFKGNQTQVAANYKGNVIQVNNGLAGVKNKPEGDDEEEEEEKEIDFGKKLKSDQKNRQLVVKNKK